MIQNKQNRFNRILFVVTDVSASYGKALNPHLGIAMLMAYLDREGFETAVIDMQLGYNIDDPDPNKRSDVDDLIENDWKNSPLVTLDDPKYGPHEFGMVVYAKSLDFSIEESKLHKLPKSFVGVQMLKKVPTEDDKKKLDFKPNKPFKKEQFYTALHFAPVLLKVLQELY